MSQTVLTHAFNQWATRPADQRFTSLADLHRATSTFRERAATADTCLANLRVVDGGNAPKLLAPSTGVQADFTHWSFGQVCRQVGAPASYLRQLPAGLAAENMNHGLATLDTADDAAMLFDVNPDTSALTLRASLSDSYTRIWNNDITSRLLRLTDQFPDWQPAPAAFDGSRGLYASDSDMFAFLVDNERRIFESAPGGGLGRGFFVWNSEVGAASFGVMTFFYEYVCGNHRVWGASGVTELRIRHVGNADDRAFGQLAAELRRYANASAADDEAKVEKMMRFTLGGNKEEVLDKVFGLNVAGLTRGTATKALELAEQRSDWYGDPRSVWGFTGGLTEIARDLPNASDRVALDRAAGKVMAVAFK